MYERLYNMAFNTTNYDDGGGDDDDDNTNTDNNNNNNNNNRSVSLSNSVIQPPFWSPIKAAWMKKTVNKQTNKQWW